jgi:dTDP-glucose 4,6-dehydratase
MTPAAALENPRVRFAYGDVTDGSLVDALFAAEKFDAVVHFAAESHVDRSIAAPDVFLRTNILGTQTLLDAARRHGNVRFHQVSTDEVYGDLPLNRPDLLFTEESPLRCSSPYSASKAGADLLCLAYARTYGLHVTVSRCSNNYGPYQFPEKLIPLMIRNALDNKPLPVYGKGTNVRDWIHVRDHCAALRRILTDGAAGEVYNVGGASERDNLTVVRSILRILGKSENLISFVPDRAGHDLRYAIDAKKMETTLGWKPNEIFEDALAETVTWYAENPDWTRKIQDGSYRAENDRLRVAYDVLRRT